MTRRFFAQPDVIERPRARLAERGIRIELTDAAKEHLARSPA
jgi:hypothetical protein